MQEKISKKKKRKPQEEFLVLCEKGGRKDRGSSKCTVQFSDESYCIILWCM